MAGTSPVEKVAHRGASKELFENTLPAFTRALERGADAVELDVHLTRDGEVIVHHDEHVGGQELSDLDWSDIARIPLKGDARIPRLSDVLGAIGARAQVYIELKGRGVADAAISCAQKHGRRYAVHAFDHSAIEHAMRAAPDVPRGVLLDRGTPNASAALAAAVARTKARDVWPHFSLVDAALMRSARSLGVRVVVWTVNTNEEASRLVQLGVDALCGDDVRIFG